MKIQHYYEFFLDTVTKKLTKLITWLTSIRSPKDSPNGLDSLIDPGQWEVLEEVPVQAFTTIKLPLGTPWVITKIAWQVGWDTTIREHGNPPQRFHDNRALVLGYHVQYCLILGQWIYPICLKRFLSGHNFTDIYNLLVVMHRLHFDHLLSQLKGQDRKTTGRTYFLEHYWYVQPLVLLLTAENLSGCFIHADCHQKGRNIEYCVYIYSAKCPPCLGLV